MMYLYDKHTTDFSRNGEPIRHAYDAHVERDEGFQLNFKLRLDEAESYKQIQPEMIISAMTPDGVNYFRVWEPVKHDTYVEVIALQLMYDLDNKLVKPFKATNATGALVLNAYMSSFLSSYTPFTISSLVDERHDFTLDEDVESYNALEVLQRIANRWDSELSVEGFDIRLIKRHGKRTNVLIHENKNISEFVDKTTIEGMATRIHARSTFRATEDAEEDTVIDVTVDSPLIDEYSQIYEKFYVNNDAKSIQELTNWVNLKYSTDNLDKPIRTIEVGTHIIDDTEINYGDDLVLKYHSHDVDEVIRCVGYDYDPISATYLGITLGSFRQSFTDAVNGRVSDGFNQAINKVTKEVQLVTATANGLNRETWGELPIPNPRKGDKWFYFTSDRPNEVELRMWDGEKWVVIVDDYTGERIKQNVQDAMDTALEAKEDAQQAYVDAVADTDAKIAVKDQEWLAWEQTYDDTVEALVDSIDEADGKAQSAISVSDTAKTIAEGADAKASTAIGTANSASATANQAVGAANEAIDEVAKIPQTIDNAIIDRGLVDGVTVDSRIDVLSGEFRLAIIDVQGQIPYYVMGFEWNKVEDPVLKRTDYLQDYVELEEYQLLTADYYLTKQGWGGRLTELETDKLDGSVFTSFKTNDYDVTVSGLTGRLTSVEDNKLNSSTFNLFKSNDYDLTVAGFGADIQTLQTDKLDEDTFNQFKQNDFDVTVDGLFMNITDIQGAIPKTVMGIAWDKAENPTLRRTDFTEDIMNLDDFELFNASYEFTKTGFTTDISNLRRDKLDGSEFSSFKEHTFDVTVAGLDGRISSKLDTSEFTTFKTNDYDVTVDGFKSDIQAVNQKIPNYILGVEWDKSPDSSLTRTDYTTDTASINFVNNLVEETADSFSRTIVEVQGEFPAFVSGVEWDKESDPTLERTGITRDNAKAFSQLKQTQDGIYALVGDNKESLATSVMESNKWVTDISGPNGLSSKVTQLENSWGVSLKNGDDVVAGLNLTSAGVRIKGATIHLDGNTLIDNALIKSAHIQSLKADKIEGTSAEFNKIRTGVLTADVVDAKVIKSDIALIDKIFAEEAYIKRLTAKTAFIESINALDIDAERITSGTLNATNVNIINLDVNSLSGNKSTFLQSLWQSTNSQSSIDGNRIRIDNTAGDFIEMNNIPEIRTDDADGTATVMGKGRVHFYDKRGHSKGYMGTDMHTANANDFGIWLSKGSGTFSFARMADATQVNYLYYTVKSGMNWRVAVLEDMVRLGLIPDGNAQQFVANSNNIAQLNGWPTLPQDWPNLTVGQQIRYKEIPGQVTGEAYHKMIQIGPSSGSDWRAYFNIQARFNAGFTDASDRRLKRDIEDSAIDALGHINNLEFKEFTMRSDDRYEPIGLIAQEAGILRVADDEMEGINIPRAIMLALKGIQELNRKVGELGKPSTTKHNQ